MPKLIGLYTSILRAAGLVVDAEGYVSLNNQLYMGTPNTPALIGGKRIVLPTEHNLRNPSNSTINFHPLREQVQRGESDTAQRLRNAIGIRLNFTFQAVMNEMIDLAKNRGAHKNLGPDQAVALMAAKDVTENTHAAYSELLLRGKDDTTKPFVSIYVKKSAIIKDRNYFRAGIVTFPMYQELKDAEKPLGYAISEKERKNLLRLMEFIMPDIETPNSYDRGSNSGVAPHMDALLKAFDAVASRLNAQIDTFHDVFKHPGLRIDDDWVEPMQDLEGLQSAIQFIPQQPGNDGSSAVVVTPGGPALAQVQTNAPAPAPHPQAIKAAPPPNANGTVNFDQLMSRAANPPAVHTPVYTPPPAHPYPHLQNYPGMPQMVPGVGMVPQHVLMAMAQQQQQMVNPNAPRGNWAMPGMMNNNPQMMNNRPGVMVNGMWMSYA